MVQGQIGSKLDFCAILEHPWRYGEGETRVLTAKLLGLVMLTLGSFSRALALITFGAALACSPRLRDFGEPKDGAGGQGGADAKEVVESAGVGTFGEPCAPDGALACEGHAQRVQLRCTMGTWVGNGTCANDALCDTSEANRGLCQPIVTECSDKEPDEIVCLGSDRVTCGADLVSTILVESCHGCRPEHCYCPEGMIVTDGAGVEGCLPCAPGTYSSTKDATECIGCSPGEVSLQAGATTCSPAQVAAGGSHTCALLTDGNVRCWGAGASGRLGYGNTSNVGDMNTPASAGNVDVGGTVTQIATGFSHTCAVLTNGNVRCWGSGENGRLGYGNTNNVGDTNTPASAGNVNVGGNVAQVAAGFSHTCALLTSGNVRCWGSGEFGQLGYGNTNEVGATNSPASAGNVPVGGTVTQVAAGSNHTCALLADGNVRCWGSNSFGQLGYSNTSGVGPTTTPASAGDVTVGGTVTQIAANGNHTCALLADGGVRCWGDGFSGQLGYGNQSNVGPTTTPASAGNVDVGGAVIQLAAGGSHTCALLTQGKVRCWGAGAYGRLGYGNQSSVGANNTPASAGDAAVGGMVTQVTAGSSHTCALLTDGNIRCWGSGLQGRLGYGSTAHVGEASPPSDAGNVPYL